MIMSEAGMCVGMASMVDGGGGGGGANFLANASAIMN